MGNILLLTREEEVRLAKKIERSKKMIFQELSRTRLILNEILSLEKKIDENPEIIRKVCDYSEDGIPECEFEEKKKQILAKVYEIKALKTKLKKILLLKNNIIARGRIIVKMSLLIQDLNIRPNYRKKIIKYLREKLSIINRKNKGRIEFIASKDEKQKKRNRIETKNKRD